MEFSEQQAQTQLNRLRGVLGGLGVRFIDIEPRMMGVGLAVSCGEAGFVVLSVSAGNSSHVYATAGALRDVGPDKLAVLEACNDYVAERSEVPVYLHDADIGWDVLAQTCHPVELYVDVPAYCGLVLRAVPNAAEGVRAALAKKGVVGVPHQFGEADVNRLFMTSMV